MADTSKSTESTTTGTESNTVVGSEEAVQQTPDQFYDPAVEAEKAAEAPVPADHATKGMSSLGYTEASRIEDTAAQQEADREAAEKAAPKE